LWLDSESVLNSLQGAGGIEAEMRELAMDLDAKVDDDIAMDGFLDDFLNAVQNAELELEFCVALYYRRIGHGVMTENCNDYRKLKPLHRADPSTSILCDQVFQQLACQILFAKECQQKGKNEHSNKII